jgi:hypothetical protein
MEAKNTQASKVYEDVDKSCGAGAGFKRPFGSSGLSSESHIKDLPSQLRSINWLPVTVFLMATMLIKL